MESALRNDGEISTHTSGKSGGGGRGVAVIQSRLLGLSDGRVRSKEPLVCEENVGKHKHTPHTAAPLSMAPSNNVQCCHESQTPPQRSGQHKAAQLLMVLCTWSKAES